MYKRQGLTPARKLAALCEQFGVRMAWHGSPDMSPIGYAVNLHLDMAVANFGIQEWPGVPEPMAEMFPGCPYIKGGYAYVSGKPGWGVEFDEKMAAEYPVSYTHLRSAARIHWESPGESSPSPQGRD